MNNYETLLELVHSGKLRVISVLAPTRTISTALARSIAAHPDVSAEVSQPLHLKRPPEPMTAEEREEHAFGLILTAYREGVKDGSKEGPVNIVVKEMTRNLVTPETVEKWNEICRLKHKVEDKEISQPTHIVTIRNPLLAIESILRLYQNFIANNPEGLENMARQFAEEHAEDDNELGDAMRDALSDGNKYEAYAKNFHNVYARHVAGYTDPEEPGEHWNALIDSTRKRKEYRELGNLLDEFFPFYDLNLQFLDIDACALGNMPYMRSMGWHGLGDLETFFEQSDTALQFIDGTILRAQPESTARAICRFAGLDEENAYIMKDWGAYPETPTVDDYEPDFRMAFTRAEAATKLDPPTESPIPPSRFPEAVKKHFSEVVMPLYLEALADERCVRPDGTKLVDLLKTESDGRRLRDIDPVWAYCLVSTDRSPGFAAPPDGDAPYDKEALLEDIRQTIVYIPDRGDADKRVVADYSEVYNLINRIVRILESQRRGTRGQGGEIGI